MASKKEPLHYVHFQCNGANGFVEAHKGGEMWVLFAGERMAYTVMQGRLKNAVHAVMVQFGFVSAWRG